MRPALRTMGLGARGGWAVFLVGALLVLALLKAVVDSEDPAGEWLPGCWPRLREGVGGEEGALPCGSFQVGICL